MKSKVNFFKRLAVSAVALLFVSASMFADGEINEVYLTGATNTAAGDYVVTGTDDVYHFQGQEFVVYNVYYDDPSHNMKIELNTYLESLPLEKTIQIHLSSQKINENGPV